jgi:glutamate synthase (NADPH/NADH) small chain
MDAARCALRLGAEEVSIVYRRGFDELPARKEEIHHAQEEGIQFKTLRGPLEIMGDMKTGATGIKCQVMELGEPDEKGRRKPVPVEGEFEVIEADVVIIAIGTSPNPLIRQTTQGLEFSKKGGIVADDEKGQTSLENVFAGGDVVTGAATVILAMGAGKKSAAAIDEYIKNKK